MRPAEWSLSRNKRGDDREKQMMPSEEDRDSTKDDPKP
jgi:hypothetical protein